VNTHFGLGRQERWAQAQLLTSDEWTSASDIPIVLLGDFNSLRWSRSFRLLGRKLRNVRTLIPDAKRIGTFPTKWPVIALDHVFVNAALQPTSVSAHRTPLARLASDHYPLVVDLELTRD
jgi:endonuclease/exonuclease/phosphatase family metal-dependent hydrolase